MDHLIVSGSSIVSYRTTVLIFRVRPVLPRFFLGILRLWFRQHRVILIHQNAMRIAFQIIVLTAFHRPHQNTNHDQAEKDHARDKHVDHFQCRSSLVNIVRMRAALPITSNELMGMEMAATNGVMKAAMANGTMMML